MKVSHQLETNIPSYLVVQSNPGNHSAHKRTWTEKQRFHKATGAKAYARLLRKELKDASVRVEVLDLSVASLSSPTHPRNFFDGKENGYTPDFVVDAVTAMHKEAKDFLNELTIVVAKADPMEFPLLKAY